MIQLNVLTIITVLIAVAAFWVALIVISHLNYRQALGPERLYRRYQRGLPYTTSAEALEVAAERRKQIDSFIREFQGRSTFPFEFLEMPPGFTNVPRREFREDDAAGAWHAARLRNELTDDRYLVAGRVLDAMTCLRRSYEVAERDAPYSVRVEPLEIRSSKRQMFRWRVVIETPAAERLQEFLDPLQRWLGVGVDFAKPLPVVPHGRCESGQGGREGVVCGSLRIANDDFYVTCFHVLSDACGSQHWPPPGNVPVQFNQSEPDVALLRPGGPCSLTRPANHTVSVTCMNAGDIKWAQQGNVKFKKIADTSRRRGRIDFADVRSFNMGGHEYLGPHILMTTDFVMRFWVYWPLFPRRFSEKGESGTWIVDEQSGEWLGMIVGGYEPPLIGTVVLAGHHLLEAVGASLNSGVWPTVKTRE